MRNTIIAVVAAVFLAVPLAAQPPAHEHGPDCDHGKQGMRERLDLTDEQLEQLEAIRHETENEAIRLRAEIEIKENELRREFTKDETDKAAVNKLVKDISQLSEKMMRLRVDSLLKTKEILTPEQFRKLGFALEFLRGAAGGQPGPGGPPHGRAPSAHRRP